MSIKRFNDYDTVKAYSDFPVLPRGGYVMEIKGATPQSSQNGDYIKIALDIKEGEYAGFYEKEYASQSGTDRKWRCHYLLNVPKDDGSERDDWSKRSFKTFTAALEESNPGYLFDWEEDHFKGLLIGGLFNMREYEKSDGSIGKATNMARVTTVEKIRKGDYTIPNDTLLKGSGSRSGSGDDFMDAPSGISEELPF